MEHHNTARKRLAALITAHSSDMSALSVMLGRNIAYIQQYLKRGSPKILPERERTMLAQYFAVDPVELGAPAEKTGAAALKLVPRLAIGASAGSGALNDSEALAGKIGFDPSWLKKQGLDPSFLSLIKVEGDSMAPTLLDGDDILVDASIKGRGIASRKTGAIYVLRFDDVLMVKRVTMAGKDELAIISDNPAHKSWASVKAGKVTIIGRVVWTARRI